MQEEGETNDSKENIAMCKFCDPVRMGFSQFVIEFTEKLESHFFP